MPDLTPPRDRVAPDAPPSFIRPRPGESTTVIPKPDLQRPGRGNEWPPPEPPRAAPQRVGPPPPEPPAPRKPKKRLLIVAVAIVAVLGLAAGVIFGVPGVAAKLGLTGEEAVAIDPPPAPITYTPGLHGPDASAPAPTAQGVQQALAGPIANPALGTLTGVVIDPATGGTLYERDAGTAITPASTGKVLTAAAALLSLDHTQQLVTKVVQGDQPGEVIIVGGGDPTISSLKVGSESMYPGAAHLSDLVDQVKASGATVSTVYIDESRYTGPGLATSWLPADVAAGYIAPIVPAMLDGDRQDATKNYSPRTNNPGTTLVNEFATRIGATAGSSVEKKAPAGAKVLGEIRSAPMAQLVDNMLDRSENTLGDILAHEVAIKAGKEPSFDGAADAMLEVLRQNNFDVEGAVLRDGSGMSTENKVSAKLLAQILAVAAGPDGKDPRTAKLRPLLGGLPVAGGSGTLEDRYGPGAAAEGRGWVRAKTGTLTGVNSLAGIVLDKDNRPLVFAFLTTGTNGGTARPALDTVSAALRGCGCQS
jgi:D-alanyl-D-alanine carboxypeptidase/D-alanyl-D-alanine-endopeptidase (penicillin-binding protein 4)